VKILDAQSSLRKRKISEMIEHLKAKEEGGVVNIGELVFATVFNMLSNVLLSKDLIGMKEKTADGRMKGLMRSLVGTIIAPNFSEYFPILSSFDFQKLGDKAMMLVAKIQAIWEPIIEERRKAGIPLTQNDFLDVLLANNFNNAQIHQLILELFIAGTDTSAATIEWVMAELIKSPESMKKVRQEIDQEFGTNPVEESGLIGLPYLHACIKETLRLHPPVPLLLHRAHEECDVMNYRIPRNAKVMVNVWAIGRDPTNWDEPLKFKPERFLDSDVDFKGNDFELLPFSAGRRICPGLPMAGRHVPLILAALNQSFDWCVPDGKVPQELDMTEKFGLIMQKEKPLELIPKPRK
jgi:cytochrome P450